VVASAVGASRGTGLPPASNGATTMSSNQAISRPRARVLIVDDDRALGETLADELSSDGFETVHVADSVAAARLLEQNFDALVTDLRMPSVDGLGILARSRAVAPDRPVIVMTAFSAVDTAIESIRQGAYHYLTKPFGVDELALFLERALAEASLRREAAELRRALRDGASFTNLVGQSGAMRAACSLAARVADASTPVLLLGETGTGKGLIAHALHARSRRSSRAFVTMNCAAVPDQLLETELFGHVRGAFTGATTHRVGLLEEADGGTLFLDEIGEMTMPLQAKLLDVLERGVVRAVGSNREKALDVRIVAATHRDVRRQVAAGEFREDLLFRLDVVTITIPPLRDRKEDLPELVAHFLELSRRKHSESPVRRLSQAVFERMLAHDWPGNVRELANVVERVVLLGSSEEVGIDDLPAALTVPPPSSGSFSGAILPLQEIERRYARWALDQLGGRKMATAEKLEIDRKTLARLLGEPVRPELQTAPSRKRDP
jgi:two-component system, NtrC family, response regulator HydG